MTRCNRRHPRLLLPAVLTAITASCGFADRPRDWVASVDTLPNGAVRVVNQPPADGAPPTWTIEEELRIGSMSEGGASSFGQVKGIAVLEDGRIAVLDAQARELRIFGPDGRHRATYGRQGAGPGEMESPYGLMLAPGGELWVPDHRNARMSVFHPDWGYVRSHPMRVFSYGYIWAGTMAPDGRVLEPSMTIFPERANLLRVYGPDMTLVDSLPMPDYPTTDEEDPPHVYTWGSREAGAFGMRSVPFYPQIRRTLDPAGVFWSAAMGDAEYRIMRWEPGGDTTLVIEARRPPVPVTAAERDSALAPITEALQRRGAPAPDPGKVPPVKPAVESMFVAEDGRLWVRAATADSLLTYDVYGRDGHHDGTALTALNIYPYLDPVLRGDRFWAVVTDELDVQYVVRGRLRGMEPKDG